MLQKCVFPLTTSSLPQTPSLTITPDFIAPGLYIVLSTLLYCSWVAIAELVPDMRDLRKPRMIIICPIGSFVVLVLYLRYLPASSNIITWTSSSFVNGFSVLAPRRTSSTTYFDSEFVISVSCTIGTYCSVLVLYLHFSFPSAYGCSFFQ